MKYQSNRSLLLGMALLLASGGLLSSCNDDDDDSTNVVPQGQCYVQLYDGDKFEDDNIIINGPVAQPNLRSLPNTTKDWNDEADALKVGPRSRVTTWPRENYQGDSTVYEAGAQVPSINGDIQSLKVRCK